MTVTARRRVTVAAGRLVAVVVGAGRRVVVVVAGRRMSIRRRC